MTAALTSVGVQYVSIVIAGGATTGTAAITAVGAGAKIRLLGQNYSASGTDNTTGLARVEKTSSTLITATRNTSDANSITVKAVITDGDTATLIKSVQSGTIVVSTASNTGTAALSAVTAANAATESLGYSSVGSQLSIQKFQGRLSFSGTTMTATRAGADSVTGITMGYQLTEYQGTALNSSTQNISQSSTSGLTADTVITSVTTANTQIAYGGSGSNFGNNMAPCWPSAKLKDATHFTGSVNTDPGGGTRTVNGTVTEFKAAMLTANAVQRGSISLAAAASGTLTITSVTQAQAEMSWLFNTTSLTSINEETGWYISEFTNATTLTMRNAASVTGVGQLEITEFNPAGASETITLDKWIANIRDWRPSPRSNAPYAQSQGPLNTVFAENINLDKWTPQFPDRVIPPRMRPTDAMQQGPVSPTFGETATLSKWNPIFPDRARVPRAHPQTGQEDVGAISPTFAENVNADKWLPNFPDRARVKRAHPQLGHERVGPISGTFTEAPQLDKWNPVFPDRGARQRQVIPQVDYFQFIASTETLTLDKWLGVFPDRARAKPQGRAGLEVVGPIATSYAENVLPDKWMPSLAEVMRPPSQFAAQNSQQQFFQLQATTSLNKVEWIIRARHRGHR